MAADYVDTEWLANAAGLDSASDGQEDLLGLACAATTEWIDGFCGRSFFRDANPTSKLLVPRSRFAVWCGDIADLTGLILASDDDYDGVWHTWNAGEWHARPINPLPGRPYTLLHVSGTRLFPTTGQAPTVKVTTRFGWAAVPKPVTQAAQMLALAYYRSNNMTGTSGGFDERSTFGAAVIGLAEHLLTPYQAIHAEVSAA